MIMDRPARADLEIAALDPPHACTVRPDGAAVYLALETTITPGTVLEGMMARLMKSALAKALTGNPAALKDACERA